MAIDAKESNARMSAVSVCRRGPSLETFVYTWLVITQLELIGTDSVTTALAAVPVLRDRAVLAAVVPADAPEITRVTTGAIGRELGVRPADDLGVVAVTRGTGKVAPMIERLVQEARVHPRMRYPGKRLMALVAVAVRDEVPRIAAGRDHTVVA